MKKIIHNKLYNTDKNINVTEEKIMRDFKSNAEYVEEACESLDEFLRYSKGNDEVLGCFLYYFMHSMGVFALPNPPLEFENIKELEPESGYIVGNFNKSDFKTGVPSADEMENIRQELERVFARIELETQLEKKSFEYSIRLNAAYDEVVQNLTPTERGKILLSESSRKETGLDEVAKKQLDEIWDRLPEVGFRFTLWRAGDMQSERIAYISATYSKATALKWAGGDEKKVHAIEIYPTAKVFPMFLLDENDPERDVIVKTGSLKEQNVSYMYK